MIEMRAPEKCLVHLSTTEAVPLAGTFVTIAPILVEGCLKFDEKGLHVKGINTIILCDMTVTDPDEYVCVETISIYVNMAALCNCISSVSQDEIIVMQLTEESMNAPTPYLAIFIINTSDGSVFSFSIPQLALTYEDFDVPKVKFESVISIPSDKFQRVLRACSTSAKGQYVQICTRNQGKDDTYIVFNTIGDDSSMMFYMRYNIPETEWREGSCDKKDVYSLKYLQLIAKGAPMSNCVTLYLARDFVLAVAYNIGTIGKITFCLAPRVEKSNFLPPHITPIREILPSRVEDSDEELAEVALMVDHIPVDVSEIQQLRKKKTKTAKKKGKPKHKEAALSEELLSEELSDWEGGVQAGKATQQKKKAKSRRSSGLSMTSREETEVESTKRKQEKATYGMAMHDSGESVKKVQPRKKKRKSPEKDHLGGHGSIVEALRLSEPDSATKMAITMSASNMKGISTKDINSTLMKKPRNSSSHVPKPTKPPVPLFNAATLDDELKLPL
jgi:DNA polymerase III sliding clamp (beta) subunit (PCNA family)